MAWKDRDCSDLAANYHACCAIIRQQKNVAVCLPAREYDQAAEICNFNGKCHLLLQSGA